MNNTLSLSVILPIKSSKAKDFNEYFEKAITSLKNQQLGFEELVIVHTQEEQLKEILKNGPIIRNKRPCMQTFLFV